ncbi:GNAT family acetyltransferase [Dictyobacter alpinus]|uniref:GNAT family acetyltransferase n=1 Tax=Dictyobacter alpinus TaxID=2014873 RepID=A0A402B6C5_9CHLR|nr:GNAT family N-acetyltransferase [Dictyobacter alpinus]GCE26895.1 GNAT family acetyltransferase [Dictyobacter alpinus]
MQVTTEHIQPYDENNDLADVHALWQASLSSVWPINQERMQKVLAGPEPQHFVVRMNGHVVGFVATSKHSKASEKIGQLVALVVDPTLQRQGIGTALLDTALNHFREQDIKSVRLGSVSPRFWCGMPENLPAAQAFFQNKGWDLSATVYDLVQDLSDYKTPERILERIEKEKITISSAQQQNITDVLAFEARHFANWLPQYERCADLGDFRDLLVAHDESGEIIGTLIMYSEQSHPERTDVIWQDLLGETTGAMAAVGVAESERGRGIGIALVAGASELLKERGVGNCFIDWVELTDFYAKVGYEKWRAYHPCVSSI